MTLEVLIIVPTDKGETVDGIAKVTGKPYRMFKQEIGVQVVGNALPQPFTKDIWAPKDGANAGQPEWLKKGTYIAPLYLTRGDFGKPVFEISWKNLRPYVAAAQKAA